MPRRILEYPKSELRRYGKDMIEDIRLNGSKFKQQVIEEAKEVGTLDSFLRYTRFYFQ